MMYGKIIENKAIEFIKNHEDDIKKAIVDEIDLNRIDGIESEFNADVYDIEYTPADAIFVIEHSSNQEGGAGMWEGLEPIEGIKAEAAYTFGNDVHSACNTIYIKIASEYEDLLILMFGSDETDDVDKVDIANEVFTEFKSKHMAQQIKVGSKNELNRLKCWQKRSNGIGAFWSGPLGSSYIDVRRGAGYGHMDLYDYVQFDRLVADELPHMAHKYRKDVQKRIDELENIHNR